MKQSQSSLRQPFQYNGTGGEIAFVNRDAEKYLIFVAGEFSLPEN